MNTVVQRVLAWLLVLGAALAPMPVTAFSYIMMEDDELFDASEGVATAHVERVLPAADGESETRYELRILDVLAGSKLAGHETLVLPGTFTAPNLNFVVPGVPRLKAGGTILLFHARRADGVLQPKQLSLGVFGRVETAEGAYYVRQLEGAREFAKRATTLRFHASRAAMPFERWIADRGRGVARAPDYLRGALAVDDATKFTFAMFNLVPPGPARWFQFDTSQTLVWRAMQGGQATTASDEFAALQQALAAWTDDANSRILTSYGGTVADAPVPGVCMKPQSGLSSFSGVVCWNDPAGLINGSFNCQGGGVLAIGGSFASSNGQFLNGQMWYPRSDGFVVIQDGAGCFMDGASGANGAELLTHEVGHALAFGHSCGDGQSGACSAGSVLDMAIMRASAHGGGRGAVLGDDDRAAAAIAYPVPGGGDTMAPMTPTNLVATANGSASINTSWNASSDSGGSGLAGYELERCLGAGCNNFAEIAEPVATNVADNSVAAWTTYRYRVRAFDGAGNRSTYSNIAVATTAPPPPIALLDGVAVSNVFAAQSAEGFFTLQVPPGASSLVFQTFGGTGDADLYVRFGAAPTVQTFDCKSDGNSNAETCNILAPQAGTYHVLLLAFSGYSGLSLVGDFSVTPACTGNCVFRHGFE